MVVWEWSASETAQPVLAQVVPDAVHFSVEGSQRGVQFEAHHARPVSSATDEDLDRLVEVVVNVLATYFKVGSAVTVVFIRTV